MSHPSIRQIDKNYIASLLTNQVREGRTLDYKDRLLIDDREKKKELLADVTAFANAAGGDIIYGIQERRDNSKPTGIPESVSGLGNINRDAVLLRLGGRPRISPDLSLDHFLSALIN